MEQFVYNRCVERVVDELTLFYRVYETCLFQQIQMVRDARLRDLEVVSDFSCRQILFFEKLNDLPPGRVI